jgi:hypothetical protein
MATAGISISSQGVKEYRDLARRLREAGRRELRAALRKHIADAGRPVLDEVRTAARTLPVSGSRGGGTAQRRRFATANASDKRKLSAGRRKVGLRRSIASAIKLQVTARGVRFIVNSTQLPPDQRTLPRHLDSPKGWRHPVFGNREQWVHQEGKPYFATTIKKRAPQFRRAILDAMEEIRRELEG